MIFSSIVHFIYGGNLGSSLILELNTSIIADISILRSIHYANNPWSLRGTGDPIGKYVDVQKCERNTSTGVHWCEQNTRRVKDEERDDCFMTDIFLNLFRVWAI